MPRPRNTVQVNNVPEKFYKFWNSFCPGICLSLIQIYLHKNNEIFTLPIILSSIILSESGIYHGIFEGRISMLLLRIYSGVLFYQIFGILVEMIIIYYYEVCMYPVEFLQKPECWFRSYNRMFPIFKM